MSDAPVPSRFTSTTSLVSFVARSTRAVRLMGSSSQRGAVIRRDLTQRGEERFGLLGGPGGDPQPTWQADGAHQHPAVEEWLPGGGGVGDVPEEHEVRIAG